MLFFQGKRRNEKIQRKPEPGSRDAEAPSEPSTRDMAKALGAQSDELKREIEQLEMFLEDAPALAVEHRLAKRDLVPPPEDMLASTSQSGIGIHLDRPTRAQIDDDRRHRQQQMILFILLLSGLIAFLVWIVGFLETAGF